MKKINFNVLILSLLGWSCRWVQKVGTDFVLTVVYLIIKYKQIDKNINLRDPLYTI